MSAVIFTIVGPSLSPHRPLVKKAYKAMENAGIVVTDGGPWNLVWDGERVTVIDYLDLSDIDD